MKTAGDRVCYVDGYGRPVPVRETSYLLVFLTEELGDRCGGSGTEELLFKHQLALTRRRLIAHTLLEQTKRTTLFL